jgi:cytochrome c peroxidase
MKKQKIFVAVFAVCLLLTGASMVMAGKISVELGEEMFYDSKLNGSTNESSCNSCHASGKGLENVESKMMTMKVNSCLVGKLAGEKLDGRQAPMRSLKKYILSLQN